LIPNCWVEPVWGGGAGMDAAWIDRLEPHLHQYLGNFADCFGRSDTRGHLPVYVRGQLSDLPRKSVEPIALAAGVPPRTLQQFLSLLDWDHDRLRQRLHTIVGRDHAHRHAVGIIDETGCAKKGAQTPGVRRQYCGATGKIDNCIVTVHLGYAAGDFHCLMDSDLYLPQEWAEDRERCRAAGIPDAVGYRPKWQIALDLLDRAAGHGVRFAWLTFDEGYGGKPEFLRELHHRGHRYVAEVPTTFTGWVRPPRLRGDRRLRPEFAASSVADLLRHSPRLRDQPWQRFRVKDGQKGPMVWEAKRVRFYPKTAEGDPAGPIHLVVARNALDREGVKYFLSNAPAGTRLETLLLVAFSRWRVERCFEDEKTELGFDHYEGRTYVGLLRHQLVTAVSHLFLARVHQAERGEKSGPDRVPGADRGRGRGSGVGARRGGGGGAPGPCGGTDPVGAGAKRQGTSQPYEANCPQATRRRHSTHRSEKVLLGK
jgi:SRSO17 transposase